MGFSPYFTVSRINNTAWIISAADNSIGIIVRACSSYQDFCDSAPAVMTTMSQKMVLVGRFNTKIQ